MGTVRISCSEGRPEQRGPGGCLWLPVAAGPGLPMECPAVREPHRRRTALLAAVLAFAAAGILALGIWLGFGMVGTKEKIKISWDNLVVKENVNAGEEFDLVPWE